jgi:hypothetical protein
VVSVEYKNIGVGVLKRLKGTLEDLKSSHTLSGTGDWDTERDF